MKRTLYLLTLGTALSAAAIDDGFTPYRTIIDRMPFGRPGENAALSTSANGADVEGGGAAGAVLDPETEKEIERIRASVRVCAVNAPPGAEPVVGFTDMSQNPPRHHLLAQGPAAPPAPPASPAPESRAEARPSHYLHRARKQRASHGLRPSA